MSDDSAVVLVLMDDDGIVYDKSGNKVEARKEENPMHIVLGYASNRSAVKKELRRMLGTTFMTVMMTTEWKSNKSVALKDAFSVHIVSVDQHQLHLKSVTSWIVDSLSRETFTPSARSPFIEVADVNTAAIPRKFKLRFAFSTNKVISDYIYPRRPDQLSYKCFACEKEANFFDASVVKAFCSKTCATATSL